jgi:hypothetical protein
MLCRPQSNSLQRERLQILELSVTRPGHVIVEHQDSVAREHGLRDGIWHPPCAASDCHFGARECDCVHDVERLNL